MKTFLVALVLLVSSFAQQSKNLPDIVSVKQTFRVGDTATKDGVRAVWTGNDWAPMDSSGCGESTQYVGDIVLIVKACMDGSVEYKAPKSTLDTTVTPGTDLVFTTDRPADLFVPDTTIIKVEKLTKEELSTHRISKEKYDAASRYAEVRIAKINEELAREHDKLSDVENTLFKNHYMPSEDKSSGEPLNRYIQDGYMFSVKRHCSILFQSSPSFVVPAQHWNIIPGGVEGIRSDSATSPCGFVNAHFNYTNDDGFVIGAPSVKDYIEPRPTKERP
jgi:hypothetical protein